MRSQLLLLIGVLALVLAALVLLLGDGTSPGGRDDGRTRASAEGSPSEARVEGDDGSVDRPLLSGSAGEQGMLVDGGGGVLSPAGASALAATRGPAVDFAAAVRDASGRPVAGVRVSIVSGADGFAQEVTTDAEGRFRTSIPRGRYDLLLTSGRSGLFVRDFLLDGAAEGGTEFTLGEVGRVEVEVLRGTTPLGGATVALTMGTLAFPGTATTSSDGRASIDSVPKGTGSLSVATSDGWSASRTLEVRGDTSVRIVTPDVALVEGRVHDADSGLGIVATLDFEARVRNDSGETTVHASGSSRDDGSYRLVAPRHPMRLVTVSAPEYAPWPAPDQLGLVLSSLRPLAKGLPVTLDVPLSRGTSIGGRATDETGAPAPGVVLRFTDVRGRVLLAQTGEDGRYAAENANPGAWTVSVATEGWFPPGRLVVSVPAGGGSVVFDVALVRGRWLEGTVVHSESGPAAGAHVYLAGDGGILRSTRNAGRALETFSDASGAWRLDDVPSDRPVWVRASLGPLEATPVVATKTETAPLRLVLEAPGTIRGDVVDLATRDRVPGATVRADPVGEPPVRGARLTTTDANGEYVFEGLLVGDWNLTPQKGQEYLAAEPIRVTLSREAKETRNELRLDPGLVFAGVVLDDRGRGISGATVHLDGTPDGGPRTQRAAKTDLRGEFRLTGFRSGSYQATARAPGYRAAVLGPLRGGEQTLRFGLVPSQ